MRRELERVGEKTQRLFKRLKRESDARAAAETEVASLKQKIESLKGAEDQAKVWAKLHNLRETSDRLKADLLAEQKRTRRLAVELEAANEETRVARLEARQALSDSRLHRAELELDARVANDGDGAQSADWDAAKYFQLGRALQVQGDIGVAAAAYRRVGPAIRDLLAQEGPDGDQVSGPDFIIIGAARSGTTWLKKCLSYHPQVFVLASEHHYFSISSHLPPESYVARFSGPHARFQRPGMKARRFAPPFERIYGEKTTTYLAMPDAQIELCTALYPKARLVCMVRDPVERVWSHMKHLDAAGNLKFWRMADAAPMAQVDELIRQCRYEEHLTRWASRIDPGQILLVDFARIAREPAAVYQEVLGHIGATPSKSDAPLDEIGATEPADIPPEIAEHLHAALDGERYDIPHLRAAMDRAARAQLQDASPGRMRERLLPGVP